MREELIKKYLFKDPRAFNPEINDVDLPLDRSIFLEYRGSEFSEHNAKALLDKFLKVKDKTNTIVEIGVARLKRNQYSAETGLIEKTEDIPFEESSTSIFLNNKNPFTKYLGIDIEDKLDLELMGPNIYTLKSKSENYKIVSNKFQEVGIEQIDFLFIDGWHSINQVIDELWYLQFMKPGGIIGFHDVNHHPGPKAVLEALNPNLFRITNCQTPDWGIAFAEIK